MTLSGVEKLLVNEFRQQNVVEEVVRWGGQGSPSAGLRDVAFQLACGVAETDASPHGVEAAEALVAATLRGDIELLELVPVYGAQVLASFKAMTLEPSS